MQYPVPSPHRLRVILRAAIFLLILMTPLLIAAVAWAAAPTPVLTAIRHSSEPGHTRVVLDGTAPMNYEQALKEKNGARLLRITLKDATLAPGLKPMHAVGDGILSFIHQTHCRP